MGGGGWGVFFVEFLTFQNLFWRYLINIKYCFRDLKANLFSVFFSRENFRLTWKICFLGFFKGAFDFHGHMLWKFFQAVKDFLIAPIKSGNITVWLITKELPPSSQILDFLKEKLQYHRSLKYKRKISPSSHNFNFSKEKSITVNFDKRAFRPLLKVWIYKRKNTKISTFDKLQKRFSPSSENVDFSRKKQHITVR